MSTQFKIVKSWKIRNNECFRRRLWFNEKNPESVYGVSKLMHYGGDTFIGHQEIMWTIP